jgi:hypothetical protein
MIPSSSHLLLWSRHAQPFVSSYTPPAPSNKTVQDVNGYFQPTCALALDGQIAKRMDFDTQRRQLIYESLQE